MKRLLIAICVALLPAQFLYADSAKPQSLLYMSEAAPIFIRLHIEIDGKSYESPWDNFVNQ